MADYHSLLMRAIANLPNAGTPATRGAIYERARKALLDQLRSLRPPLPESDISREENALDAAIAEIEERYGSQEPAPPPPSTPPPVAAKPEATPAKAAPPPPPPKFATVQRPTAPPAPGPAAATARSPSQTGVPGQPGAANAAVPGAAQRPAPPLPSVASRWGARRKRQPRLRDGLPRGRRRRLRRLDPSWLLQWPTSPPPDRGPAGPLHPWGRRAARMRVCPEWRR